MVQRVSRTCAAALLIAAALTAAQEPNPEEVAAYQAFVTASQAGEVAAAAEAGRAYLQRFPAAPNAEYVRKWVTQARGTLFNQALKEGNMAEMVRLGREQLAERPDDLAYLLSLAVNLRKNVLLGSQKQPELEAAAGEFALAAIKLVEGGAAPAGGDPARWNKAATLSLLQQTAAIAAYRAERTDEALTRFEAALRAAPDVPGLAGYSAFYCGRIRKDRYDAAVAAYQARPEAERTAAEPPAEVVAALERVHAEADRAIECFAAFVGATQKNNPFGDVRATLEQALEALWASRHPDDPEGLEALIARYAEK
jgi:hypothetical protein